MSSAKKSATPTPPSPMAERIRARIKELGETESGMAETLGLHKGQLSSQLRRLDAGGNLRGDTIDKLSKLLGKSRDWIQTGVESVYPPLSADDRWPAARGEAIAVYKIDPSVVEAIGAYQPPPPKNLDGAYILLLSHAHRHGEA